MKLANDTFKSFSLAESSACCCNGEHFLIYSIYCEQEVKYISCEGEIHSLIQTWISIETLLNDLISLFIISIYFLRLFSDSLTNISTHVHTNWILLSHYFVVGHAMMSL